MAQQMDFEQAVEERWAIIHGGILSAESPSISTANVSSLNRRTPNGSSGGVRGYKMTGRFNLPVILLYLLRSD